MNLKRIPLCLLVLLTAVSACRDHDGPTPPDGTRFTLGVSLDGVGSGTVTSSPSGVNCGTDCAEDYPSGTEVTLTASASSDSTFAGWSGACTGTGACVVTTDAAKSVTAGFELAAHTLSVSKSGSGTGTVTTVPAGINCGVDCEGDYSSGIEVTLTASADGNSTFAGWRGGCAGTGACVVTMGAPTAVTAAFDVIAQNATHAVGGAVSDLTGTVVLQNNGTDNLSIASNGSFTFSNPIDEGSAYNVTVFSQPASQTCTISNGSGIMGSADVTNVGATCADNPTTLSASVSTLALASNCQPSSSCGTTQSSALTGNPRQITVTNTGVSAATNISVASTGLPSGTSISSSTCSGTLAPSGSCTITITPGSIATSSCETGIAPTPGAVTVSADNSSDVVSDVLILTFGCRYQGGFVYSVDDTTANTGSIGGKVTSLVDQAEPYVTSGPQATSIIWSSNGNGPTFPEVSHDIVPWIAEIPGGNDSYAQAQAAFNSAYSNTGTCPFPQSSAFSACSGATDGACNTRNILALYDSYITGYGIGSAPYTLSPGPTPSVDHAAGLCTATIDGYSDWYLPAICEIDSVNTAVTCPGGSDILGNLSFLIGDPSRITPGTSCSPPAGASCLAGIYWSSSESSLDPQYFAWGEVISAGSSSQSAANKNSQLGVRCSRALTP